jgi:hypothetical protein
MRVTGASRGYDAWEKTAARCEQNHIEVAAGAGARETAERAAASAPGISRVKNEILVEPPEPVDEIC